MGELMTQQKQIAARRGWMAVAGWVGAGWAVVSGHLFLALLAGGLAVFLTRNWFQYRAKWGMRF
jgi:type II secretory pathway predicted ATPase ExeA